MAKSKRDRVSAVVLRHMPSCQTEFEPQFGSDRLSDHVSNLINASEMGYVVFGPYQSPTHILKAMRALGQLKIALQEMPPQSRSLIRTLSRLPEGAIDEVLEGLGHGLARSMEKPYLHFTPPSRHNVQAANIAETARWVWALEDWVSSGQSLEVKDGPNFDRHLRDHAPRTQQHYRPGPFGRFLEDIFAALGILARDGSEVTAATALDALTNRDRQEKNQNT